MKKYILLFLIILIGVFGIINFSFWSTDIINNNSQMISELSYSEKNILNGPTWPGDS
ncbi:hypothetical protein [Anoxybacter fermentans]|uniref:hypothetical protein n=1 Tax=Anoxybacter fermentans TaxID=1323375 RepID=UPI0013DEC364|nr:hypothetical protein [Anoxybacter fermentans]